MELSLKRWLGRFLKIIASGSTILDSGCGTGEKAGYINKRGFRVIGIDTSASAIHFAQKQFSDVRFINENCIKTRFKPDSFNAVISIAVLHCFLKKERLQYIKELIRILSPGGYLFILVLSKTDTTKSKGKEIEENTFLSPTGILFHLFEKKELEALFKRFKIIEIKHHTKKSNIETMACYTLIARKE